MRKAISLYMLTCEQNKTREIYEICSTQIAPKLVSYPRVQGFFSILFVVTVLVTSVYNTTIR